jgi:pentatricopeptide repeat protein
LKRVLLEIDADPGIQNIKPFADVSQKSFFEDEQEVLFMAGSIFRLTEIKQVNGVWTIRLILCMKEENDLRTLYEHMTKKKAPTITFLTLGSALSEAGQFDKAERFFRKMLRELPVDDYSSLAEKYQGLAVVFAERGDYEMSLTWNQKALELLEQKLSFEHSDIGCICNNMGIAYWQTGRLEKAIEFLNKAINIFEKIDDEDRSHRIAACYTNMGLIRKQEKKYEEALGYLSTSLAFNEQCLPSDHHSLAETHNNIGTVYKRLGLFDIALEHFNRSLSISLRSLPPDHRNVAIIYYNMGIIYEVVDDLNLALSNYEKAYAIFHKTLPSHHPQVAGSESSLQRVKSKLSMQ